MTIIFLANFRKKELARKYILERIQIRDAQDTDLAGYPTGLISG
jgi:hypothetical protein